MSRPIANNCGISFSINYDNKLIQCQTFYLQLKRNTYLMLFQIIRASSTSIEERIKNENWAEEKAKILSEIEIKNSEEIFKYMKKQITKINNENTDHINYLIKIKKSLLDFHGGLNKSEAISLFRKVFTATIPQDNLELGMIKRRSSMGDIKDNGKNKQMNIDKNAHVRTYEQVNQYGHKTQLNSFSPSPSPSSPSPCSSSSLFHQSNEEKKVSSMLPEIANFHSSTKLIFKSSITEKCGNKSDEKDFENANESNDRKECEIKNENKSDDKIENENENENDEDEDTRVHTEVLKNAHPFSTNRTHSHSTPSLSGI